MECGCTTQTQPKPGVQWLEGEGLVRPVVSTSLRLTEPSRVIGKSDRKTKAGERNRSKFQCRLLGSAADLSQAIWIGGLRYRRDGHDTHQRISVPLHSFGPRCLSRDMIGGHLVHDGRQGVARVTKVSTSYQPYFGLLLGGQDKWKVMGHNWVNSLSLPSFINRFLLHQVVASQGVSISCYTAINLSRRSRT